MEETAADKNMKRQTAALVEKFGLDELLTSERPAIFGNFNKDKEFIALYLSADKVNVVEFLGNEKKYNLASMKVLVSLTEASKTLG